MGQVQMHFAKLSDRDIDCEFIAPILKNEDEFLTYILDADSLVIKQKSTIDNFKFGKRRLNAEKLILFTALKENTIFRTNFNSSSSSVSCDRGVNISKVKFHFRKPSSNERKYCLMALTSHTQLFMSQYTKSDSNGVFDFTINHTFFGLPPDATIYLKIYLLTLEKKYPKRWLCGKGSSTWVATDNSYHDPLRSSLFRIHEQIIIAPTHRNGRHDISLAASTSTTTDKIAFDVIEM